jgi:hypothetical protein
MIPTSAQVFSFGSTVDQLMINYKTGQSPVHIRKTIRDGEHTMKIRTLLAFFIIGLMTSCSTNTPAPSNEIAGAPKPAQSGKTDSIIAASDMPCFRSGTMYSEGAASCQSGMQYRCNAGEWLSLNVACTPEVVAVSKPCQFADITYPTGAASCQAGTQYRCEDGAWNSLAIACSGGDSPIRLTPGGRTCMFGGVTVATSSTVCRSGSTFLCSNGEWVNLGTLCR